MKTLIHTVCLTVLTAALAPAAFANQPRYNGKHPGQPHRAEYARVIHAEPINRRLEARTPAREARREAVRYPSPAGHHHDVAGAMIVGGIIGSVIGHQLGEGHGNGAATLVGALIGSSLAYDATYRSARDGRYKTGYEGRHHGARRAHNDGHRATYRHPYDPGPQVRVNIDLR